jgi:hypothetical protein
MAEDLQRPLLANCLWTALNSFGDEPDPWYQDIAFALTTCDAWCQRNRRIGRAVLPKHDRPAPLDRNPTLEAGPDGSWDVR